MTFNLANISSFKSVFTFVLCVLLMEEQELITHIQSLYSV